MAGRKKKEIVDYASISSNSDAAAIPAEPVLEVKKEEVVEPLEAPVTTRNGVVANCSMLNIRKGPSSNDEPLTIVPVGTKVTIIGEEDAYYNVKINASGVVGYAIKQFIKET